MYNLLCPTKHLHPLPHGISSASVMFLIKWAIAMKMKLCAFDEPGAGSMEWGQIGSEVQ